MIQLFIFGLGQEKAEGDNGSNSIESNPAQSMLRYNGALAIIKYLRQFVIVCFLEGKRLGSAALARRLNMRISTCDKSLKFFKL